MKKDTKSGDISDNTKAEIWEKYTGQKRAELIKVDRQLGYNTGKEPKANIIKFMYATKESGSSDLVESNYLKTQLKRECRIGKTIKRCELKAIAFNNGDIAERNLKFQLEKAQYQTIGHEE
ncbi:MAG: hypothetical protein IPO62_08605 [Saprospiraceae bacterium]|nr:hypothetical protein [Saprospiraceae bacterium]